MNTDLVSVIVPVYNAERYLEKCINSIRSQIYNNIESLYIVNECFYHYMIRGDDSLTSKLNLDKYKMLKYVNESMEKSFKTKSNDLEVIHSIKYIRVKNIYSCLLDLFHKKIY